MGCSPGGRSGRRGDVAAPAMGSRGSVWRRLVTRLMQGSERSAAGPGNLQKSRWSRCAPWTGPWCGGVVTAPQLGTAAQSGGRCYTEAEARVRGGAAGRDGGRRGSRAVFKGRGPEITARSSGRKSRQSRRDSGAGVALRGRRTWRVGPRRQRLVGDASDARARAGGGWRVEPGCSGACGAEAGTR